MSGRQANQHGSQPATRTPDGRGRPLVHRLLLIACVLCLTARAPASDSWLICDANAVRDADRLWLSFVTGELFPYGDAATTPDWIDQVVDYHAGLDHRVDGLAIRDRGLSVRTTIHGVGVHVFGCSLKPRWVRIDGRSFDAYLRDEQATEAAATRSGVPNPDGPVWERYTKYAKTIVEVLPAAGNDVHAAAADVAAVGFEAADVTAAGEAFDVLLGHRLELAPLSNPCRWRTGDVVAVRVLLDGYPWPDVLVSAGREGFETQTYVAQARTDPAGTATFQLTQPGHWFFRAHIIRPTDSLERNEWESFWASLSFRVAYSEEAAAAMRSAESRLPEVADSRDAAGDDASLKKGVQVAASSRVPDRPRRASNGSISYSPSGGLRAAEGRREPR